VPRLDHRTALEQFPYEVQLVMTLLLQEVNVLREQVGLPPRTPQQVRQALLSYVRTHPRASRQGG
jgi:hypothetical protein